MNDITIVTLETASTEAGTKDYIAVGTTIDRGEDLAAKGCVSTTISQVTGLRTDDEQYQDVHFRNCGSRTGSVSESQAMVQASTALPG